MKLICAAIASMLFLYSCSSDQEGTETSQAKDTVVRQENKVDSTLIKKNDYSIVANGVRISLKDWETHVDLNSIFGTPTVTKKVLDSTADTHSGSSIKTLQFSGIIMDLFAPPGKDSGWIQNMRVNTDRYTTERGSKVGDTIDSVKKLYPDGKVFPDGRKDPVHYSWYIADEGNNNYLKLEIDQNVVKEIYIYHEIP